MIRAASIFLSPLDSLAYFEQVNDDYDKYGKELYRLLKWHPHEDLPNYLPVSYAASLDAALLEVQSITQGMSYEDKCDMLIADGFFSQALKTSLLNLRNSIKNDIPDNASFGEIWYFLRNKEQEIKTDQSLSPEEKEIPLAELSILRNLTKKHFDYMPYDQFGLDIRNGECLFGIKMDCWLDILEEHLIDNLKATLLVLSAYKPGMHTLALLSKLKVDVLLHASHLGWTLKLHRMFRNESCQCTNPIVPEATCEVPILIVIPEGCNSLYATVIAWGAGGPWTWDIVNGWRVDDLGNIIPNYFSTTNTIRVKQIDVNTDIKIGVANMCATPFLIKTLEPFSIPKEANEPGQIILSGLMVPDKCDEVEYFAGGTFFDGPAFDPNNPLFLSLSYSCGFQGDVIAVASNKRSFTVKWKLASHSPSGDLLSPGPGPASVSANYGELCTELMRYSVLDGIKILGENVQGPQCQ